MSEQILCIIDMQDYFDASKRCINGVLNEIEHAKAQKMPIVVVEYWNNRYNPSVLSPTNQSILNLLKNYRHKTFVKKFDDGGGEEIAEMAKKHHFSIDNIRMVGVNRMYCVLSTAEQLMAINRTNGQAGIIEVVRGASSCNHDTMENSLDSLRHVGVKIVNQKRKFNS